MNRVLSFRFFLIIALISLQSGGVNAQYYNPGEVSGDMSEKLQIYSQGHFVTGVENNARDYTLLKVQRLRLGARGSFEDGVLSYNFQLGAFEPFYAGDTTVALSVLDANLAWSPHSSLTMSIGQGVLPGLRGRMFSSSNMLFSERSVVGQYFTIDRDLGYQIHWRPKLGSTQLSIDGSVTTGEGLDFILTPPTHGNGLLYSGRLTFFPLGGMSEAELGSEYSKEMSDVLKIAIGGGYSYNDNAFRQWGTFGDVLSAERDIQIISFDALLRISGFTFFAEYAIKEVDIPRVFEPGGLVYTYFHEGEGWTVNASYRADNNMLYGVRYAEHRIVPVLPLPNVQQAECMLGYLAFDEKLRVSLIGEYRDVVQNAFTGGLLEEDVFGGRLFIAYSFR